MSVPLFGADSPPFCTEPSPFCNQVHDAVLLLQSIHRDDTVDVNDRHVFPCFLGSIGAFNLGSRDRRVLNYSLVHVRLFKPTSCFRERTVSYLANKKAKRNRIVLKLFIVF